LFRCCFGLKGQGGLKTIIANGDGTIFSAVIMDGKKYFFVSAKMALENKVFTYILVYNMMRFFFALLR
jgi:hypothetical protein